MIALHGIIFYTSGGEIQKIVTSKTNTQEIRSATIIDFIYGFILVFFIRLSTIPMSTTWVFIGLLAGRELAMTWNFEIRPLKETGKIILGDSLKALIGLAVSVILAFGLPLIEKSLG
jgi:phosphate/sulfate permease